AFGTVYKARDPELDRIVPLKVPRAGNLSSREDQDRFLREARSAAQVRHPNIVAPYSDREGLGHDHRPVAMHPHRAYRAGLGCDLQPRWEKARLRQHMRT